MTAYPAIVVGGYFIRLAIDEGKSITPMKLQKLIYFAHGIHLAMNEKPLISETIEAWKYGPVIPTVYHSFKAFGNNSIPDSPFYAVSVKDFVEDSITRLDNSTKIFLKQVWDIYKKFSAFQLSELTHVKDAPWSQVVVQNGGGSVFQNLPIQDEVIERYFKTQITN